MEGEIETLLDLTDSNCLRGFLELIKDFEVPQFLVKQARELKLGHPLGVVREAEQLLDTLLHPDWRVAPMQQDIPANPQIFGQIALSAGIEAIKYPSKMNAKNCLAIFIQNFENSSSRIAVMDEPPAANVPVRIDASTWRQFL